MTIFLAFCSVRQLSMKMYSQRRSGRCSVIDEGQCLVEQ